MQTGSRCRHRSWLPCEDRLVTPRILRIRRSVQVRRKGNLASTIRIDRALKPDDSFALHKDFRHVSDYAVEQNHCTKAHLAAGFNEALPCLQIDLLEEQKFNRAVIGEMSCRKNTRVVEHKKIARLNEAGQFGEALMCDRLARPVEHHHARVFAMGGRSQRDQFIGKHVIVIAQLLAHAREGSASFPFARKAIRKGKLALPCCVRLSRDMDDFGEAIDIALGGLDRIRRENEHPPRASRAALARLREVPPMVRANKAEQLAPLRERVAICALCPHLASSRTQTVFGVGNPEAELMFIGEAPGADEDRQGEPFVGRAGQLLTKIIAAMGFIRDDVYIANVLKCRPNMPPGAPGNRPPTPKEMATCLPYLTEQIEIIGPNVLVALGATAVEGLLGRREPMGKMRGRWHSYGETPLMITFHPSYLLRNQSNTEKRKVWEDMLLVLERLGRPISEKQRNYFR